MQAVKKQRREVTDVTLQEIIHCLETKDHPIHKVVPHSMALISALRDLEGMVEMQSAKTAIIRLLAQMLLQKKSKPQMNHCCIYGPPGVGKTKVGLILARIWTSLGLLKPQPKPVLSHIACQRKINEAERKMESYQKGLRVAHDVADKQRTTLNEVRSELYQLRREREKRLGSKRRRTDYVLDGLDLVIELHRELRFQTEDLSYLTAEPQVTPPPLPEVEVPIKIVGRKDLIAEYVGQTAIKTDDLIKSCIGKVVFIDEAYSLCQDDRDWFGHEALTVINRWMSECPDEVIFIFAGYKEMLQRTIFKAQPGLERRCTWVIDVDGYSKTGLQHIFEQQLKSAEYQLEEKINLGEFFREHKKEFKNYGGDTERLVQQCELIYAQTKLRELIKGEKVSYEPIITEEILQKALEAIKQNSASPKESNAYLSMFT